ncbi:DUF7673 family protein [Noviherbaspirillum aerium]|uniref:DUF7673 family protein n=1 Tax=Noviherbaspirillum aerium TaxID=2588497 RepID=UPI00124D88F3|nr:hypothetical protein [Noviherbaspirillum aerium]
MQDDQLTRQGGRSGEAALAMILNWKGQQREVVQAGIEAFDRLRAVADGDSKQPRVVASLLLHIFDNRRFPFSIGWLGVLDFERANDCILVLTMVIQYGVNEELRRRFAVVEYWDNLSQRHQIKARRRCSWDL